jgi:hypothetical protein
MDEQRRLVLLEALEQRAQAGDGLDTAERTGWKRQPDAAPGKGVVHIVGVETVECDRSPHAEGTAQRQRSVVVGLDQGKRLLARERLDAERARQAQQGTVEAVLLEQSGSPGRRLGGEIDHVGTLAGHEEHRQTVLVADEGELVAIRERLDEGLGPHVLVYVDPDHGCLAPKGRALSSAYSGDC